MVTHSFASFRTSRTTGGRLHGPQLWSRSAQLRVGVLLAVVALSVLTLLVLAQLQWASAHGKSAIINKVGALRMQSRVVGAELLDGRGSPEVRSAAVQLAVSDFDRRLRDPALRVAHDFADDAARLREIDAIAREWNERMRPLAIDGIDSAAARDAYLLQAPAFAATVNETVTRVESDLQLRIDRARLYLLSAAALLLTGVVALVVALSRQWFAPMASLVGATRRLRTGDFSARAPVLRDDEFGELGRAFNQMVEDMARLAGSLEQQVHAKTFDLEQRNQSLTLLYQVTRSLSEYPIDERSLADLLNSMLKALAPTDAVGCTLRLHGDSGGVALASVVEADDPHAELRVVVGVAVDSAATVRTERYAVAEGGLVHGELAVTLAGEGRLQSWQRDLAATMARHIGAALTAAASREEHRRLAVLEERNAIARELHDSLAQTLAYTKIQIMRLAVLLEHGVPAERSAPRTVLAELREGVTGAYRQLRELLTHFRIGVGEAGFSGELRAAVAGFEQRTAMRVALRNELLGDEFTPALQVHVLQIVREALSNVAQHARASAVHLSLVRDAAPMPDAPGGAGNDALDPAPMTVEVVVEDNGVGVDLTASPSGHFGLNIMRDRARMIGGVLTIESPPGGGTRVRLRVPSRAANRGVATGPASAAVTALQHH